MRTNNRFWKSAVRLVMYLSLFQAACVTGCFNKVARNINPCGTILNCNPAEWDWMFHNKDFPNYSVDPTCVIPGQCGEWPPLTPGGLGGGGGGGTTTTTPGTTTPGTTTTGGVGTGGFGTGGFGFGF